MKYILLLTSLIATLLCIPAAAQQVDPNMTAYGGYGYLIESSSAADVWWAEGSYKVMKDAPVPSVRKKIVLFKSLMPQVASF